MVFIDKSSMVFMWNFCGNFSLVNYSSTWNGLRGVVEAQGQNCKMRPLVSVMEAIRKSSEQRSPRN